ncbi:MAG TPA: hypothetical protein VKT18_09045, partial [Acidimicrobiales bacterium]|nr:hypothetical protein [Acidimicrobiales bacterium]
LSLGASGGGAGFSCSTAPTHVTGGVAVYAGCSYTVATASVTLTASSGALSPATATTAVSPGKATKLVYTTPPPSATNAGALFSATVAEQDAYGNLESADSSTAVTLSAGGGFGCGTVPATLTAGTATFSGCAFMTASASGYTVAAAAPSLTSATAVSTVAAGAPARLVYTTAPPSSAKAATSFPVVVAEQDAFGNLEAGDSTTTLTLSANNGGGGFSCATTPGHLTGGVATYAGCAYAVASATPYTLSGASGSLIPATSATTVYGPAVRLVYTAPPPATALAGSGFAVTVAEQDALGNVEVGDSTTALTLTAGGGFSCSTAPTHVSAGTATFSGCSFTKASSSPFTVSASSGGLMPATAPTTVSPAAATKLVYSTAPPASTTAGTTFAVAVVEEDAFGNAEVGDSTSPIALAAGGGFSCATAPSQLSGGVGAFSGCSFTHASPSAYTVSATSGALTPATAATTVSAAAPRQLVFTTAPPSSVAAGATFGVTVAEQDAFGNVETADFSTGLSLAASGGGGGFTCSTTPTHVSAGVATFTGCSYTVASPSGYTLSATSGSLTPATAATTVTPGAAAKLVYAVAPPATTTAGTTFGVTVTEQDFFGNPEVGDSTTAISLSASGGAFGCGTVPTHLSAGTVTFGGCAFAHAGSFTVTASTAQLSVAATTVVSHGPAFQLAFTTAPQSFERGSSGPASGSGTITVQLQDQEGNPVPAPAGGLPVGLLTTSGTGSFAPTSPLTIAAGTSSASFVYHDATAGTPTLTATSSGLAQPSTTQQETVLAGPATATVAVGGQAPDPVQAGSTATVQLTVTNTSGSNADFSVASVGGLPAGATSSVTSATCVAINGHGHTTGSFTVSIPTSASTPDGTSTLAVVVTQWASSHGSCSGGAAGSAQGDGTIDVTGTATQLVVVQQPTTTSHNAAIAPAVVVLVEDAGFDPVASGAQVTAALGANPGGAILYGTLTVGAPAGSASFANLRVSGPGAGDTLVFTSPGLASATTTTFTVT